eukprot:9478869-Pyramimonas_sp.AAC.1
MLLLAMVSFYFIILSEWQRLDLPVHVTDGAAPGAMGLPPLGGALPPRRDGDLLGRHHRPPVAGELQPAPEAGARFGHGSDRAPPAAAP